jgi:hypothetical protein
MFGWLVNNEFERIWKETIESSLGFTHRDWQKPSETSVNIAGVSTEIWTDHISKTDLEYYRYTKLLDR